MGLNLNFLKKIKLKTILPIVNKIPVVGAVTSTVSDVYNAVSKKPNSAQGKREVVTQARPITSGGNPTLANVITKMAATQTPGTPEYAANQARIKTNNLVLVGAAVVAGYFLLKKR